MDKISVSNKIPFETATDLDFPIKKNIKNLAESINKDIKDITACLLDRPRHKEIIDKLKKIKSKNEINF